MKTFPNKENFRERKGFSWELSLKALCWEKLDKPACLIIRLFLFVPDSDLVVNSSNSISGSRMTMGDFWGLRKMLSNAINLRPLFNPALSVTMLKVAHPCIMCEMLTQIKCFLFQIDGGMGHTAWVPKARMIKSRSPKCLKLGVGAWRLGNEEFLGDPGTRWNF